MLGTLQTILINEYPGFTEVPLDALNSSPVQEPTFIRGEKFRTDDVTLQISSSSLIGCYFARENSNPSNSQSEMGHGSLQCSVLSMEFQTSSLSLGLY